MGAALSSPEATRVGKGVRHLAQHNCLSPLIVAWSKAKRGPTEGASTTYPSRYSVPAEGFRSQCGLSHETLYATLGLRCCRLPCNPSIRQGQLSPRRSRGRWASSSISGGDREVGGRRGGNRANQAKPHGKKGINTGCGRLHTGVHPRRLQQRFVQETTYFRWKQGS
jgi:hypothetical protein